MKHVLPKNIVKTGKPPLIDTWVRRRAGPTPSLNFLSFPKCGFCVIELCISARIVKHFYFRRLRYLNFRIHSDASVKCAMTYEEAKYRWQDLHFRSSLQRRKQALFGECFFGGERKYRRIWMVNFAAFWKIFFGRPQFLASSNLVPNQPA